MRLTGSAPHFFVTDLDRSIRYYVDLLGFEEPDRWGDPPVFAMPRRDGFIVMLNQLDGHGPQPNGAIDCWDAYFWCTGVDAFHDDLRERGADIVHGPVDRALYGMREITVRDPDGHHLVFGEDLHPEGGSGGTGNAEASR